MKYVFHSSESRGHADHGWLNSYHSFSFAGYYNPERTNFGVLRVLNDDTVAGGQGFGTHPHDNMEIVSIPLEGDLEHKDSMGTQTVIREGDIQVMSAGTGIRHSEYNANPDREVKFLQIWLFPDKPNVEPRYDQLSLDPDERRNRLQQVLSPDPEDDGVWIHQRAWFHMARLDAGIALPYTFRDPVRNGVYAFVIHGDLDIGTHRMSPRDGLGVWETDALNITAHTSSELLLMEVPMAQ